MRYGVNFLQEEIRGFKGLPWWKIYSLLVVLLLSITAAIVVFLW